MRTRSEDRRSKPLWYRPALEQLERRLAPAGVNPFTTMATQLDTMLTAGFGGVGQYAQQVQAVLPILGQSLAQEYKPVQNAVNTFVAATKADIGALNPAWTEATVIQKLLATKDFNTVDAPVYDPANGEFKFTADFDKQIPVASTGFHFNLGLPGVPFSLSTQLSVSIDVNYSNVSFGLHDGAFFLEPATGPSSLLTVSLDAKAANLRFNGTIGFFSVSGSPIVNTPPIQLSIGLAMVANGATLSPPQIVGNAQVNLHLSGTLTTGPNGLTFPHIETDFLMNWDLGSSSAAVGSSSGLGTAPTVAFDNIQFGLGSFLGSMVRPIANVIDQITEPLAPLYAIMQNTPVPGLSQLSELAGLGPVTIDSLAAFAVGAGVLPPDYQLLANLGLRLHTLIELIRDAKFGPSNDALIPMGSFDLSGNSDLRTSTLTGGAQTLADWIENGANVDDLTSLVPFALDATSSVEDRIKNSIGSLNLPSVVQNQVSDVFNKIDEELRDAGNSVGLTFPLLDDPLSIYKLLLGQDVDFIKFDAQFHGDATETQAIHVWGPINATFTGTIHFDLALHAGVDTFGLREFFISVIKGNPDLSTLDDGFYVDSSVPLVSFSGGISADAGLTLPFGTPGEGAYAEAALNGSLDTAGNVIVAFVDPNQRGDHRLRPLKSGEVTGSLFHVQGKITANFSFSVIVGVEAVNGALNYSYPVFTIPLTQGVLFDTAKGFTANPLSQPLPVVHTIDVIFDANLYDDAPNSDFLDAEVVGDNLNFTYNGVLRATYPLATVRSVTIFGSDEDTLFFIRGKFGGTVPVQVNGGSGTNDLTFDDSAYNATLAAYYSVHGTHIERDVLLQSFHILAPTTLINFQGMQLVNVDAAAACKDVVYAYNLSLPTTIVGGNQGNQFFLGGLNNTLDSVLSNLTLIGGLGDDQIIVNDEGTTSPIAYTIGHGGLVRARNYSFSSPFAPGGPVVYVSFQQHLTYTGIDSVQIEASSAGNTFTVDDVPDANAVNTTAMTVVLNTGKGADNVTVAATTGKLIVHGQGGNDVVTVGVPQRGTEDIADSVFVDNSSPTLAVRLRGYTTLNINDADDATQRTVTLNAANGVGTIDGFVGDHPYPNEFVPQVLTTLVSYRITDLQAVNILGGTDVNTFNVLNTPRNTALIGFVSVSRIATHLTLGSYINTVNVFGTSGSLSIAGAGGLNSVYLGGDSAALGNLGRLVGPVTLVGSLGFLSIKDAQRRSFRYYTMNADTFTGGSPASIVYSELSLNSLYVSLADGGNDVTINGTPTVINSDNSGIYVSTGNGNDYVHVNGTGADVHIDLGAGAFQTVAVGSSTASLDAIDGILYVDGGGPSGSIEAFVSDAAATTSQTFNIDANGNTQEVTRTEFLNDATATLNTFNFTFTGQSQLYLTAGKGGDSVYINGTPAHTSTVVYGGAGQDTVFIATDDLTPPVLGPIYFFGAASQGDNASFSAADAATPAQTYIFQATASRPISMPSVLDQQVVRIAGDAPITFKSIASLSANLASVGGNFVSIQGVPTGELLDVSAADKDRIIFGNAISTPIGTMTRIRGTVSINNGKDVSVTLDDSIDSVARHIVLHQNEDNGDFITGMAPGTVYLNLGVGSSAKLLGGLGNDTFSMAGIYFTTSMSIDGGKGVNTLDYSPITSLPGSPVINVDLADGTATGLDGGIANIQKVTGLLPPGP